MKKFFTTLLFLSLSITFSFSNELMVKGNKAYQKNDFDKAIEYFRQAQDKDKNNPMINYNLANAYYKKGDYDKAIDTYKIVLDNTQDVNLKSATLYNMGNTAYRKQNKDIEIQNFLNHSSNSSLFFLDIFCCPFSGSQSFKVFI